MFKSAIVYRIASGWFAPALDVLEESLDRARFVPCGATDARSAGWVEPRGRENEALIESVDGQLILTLKAETKAVPGSAVNRALEERLQRIEDETGSRPRGKRRKELKEEVLIDLLPRAFSRFSTTRVWIDPQAGLMVVGAGSLARADEVVGALFETLGKVDARFAPRPLRTKLSPSTAMSQWLSAREAPAGFLIDRECELQLIDGAAEGDGKATVRYARHALDIDEVVAHIEQGKVATKLALTWQDRVSFVLDGSMSLKKITMLDLALGNEGGDQGNDGAEDGFDADVAIATGELGRLIPDLIEALGGELDEAAEGGAGGEGRPEGVEGRPESGERPTARREEHAAGKAGRVAAGEGSLEGEEQSPVSGERPPWEDDEAPPSSRLQVA